MFTKVDQHGVEEYRTRYMLLAVLGLIVVTVVGGGYLMYLYESVLPDANVQNWRDGIWVVTMTMTTIGYGDFYPLTDAGRMLGWAVFICGAVELGFLVGIISNATGSDKSIQNRELRSMLSEVMRKLEHMEKELNMCTNVTSDSHHLDVVFDQSPYSSKRLRDGFLTMGQDSSGMYMLSVEAIHRRTGAEYKRWIPADSMKDLGNRFHRYLEKEDEL